MEFSGKLFKSNLPPTNPLPCFGLQVLFWCHIASTSKIELKKINGNHCNYACIVVGQGRVVVVVVINTLFPSLILN